MDQKHIHPSQYFNELFHIEMKESCAQSCKIRIVAGPTSASDQMCNYIGPCIAEVHDEKCNQYCIFRGYLKGYCQASSAVPPYPLLCCCIKK